MGARCGLALNAIGCSHFDCSQFSAIPKGPELAFDALFDVFQLQPGAAEVCGFVVKCHIDSLCYFRFEDLPGRRSNLHMMLIGIKN